MNLTESRSPDPLTAALGGRRSDAASEERLGAWSERRSSSYEPQNASGMVGLGSSPDAATAAVSGPAECPNLPAVVTVATTPQADSEILQTDHSTVIDLARRRDEFDAASLVAAQNAAPRIARALAAARDGCCSNCGPIGKRAALYWCNYTFDLVNNTTRFVPFCRRCAPRRVRRVPKSRCVTCGRPVGREWPDSSDKTTRFFKKCCSGVCEKKFWKRHRTTRRAAARSGKRCGYCRKRLRAQRSDRQWCSDRCRQRAHRRMRRAEREHGDIRTPERFDIETP